MPDARLMLHFNGADGDTNTVDATGRHGTITFNGTAQLDTAETKWGTAALLLDGNSDYLSIANSEDWYICSDADEDWTIDFWVKHDDHAGTETYIQHYEDGDNSWRIVHVHGSGVRFYVESGAAVVIDTGSGGEITDTNWHHIALCKVGDEYGLYVDGSQVAYTQDSSVDTFAGSLYIGATGTPGNYYDGSIDELRIDNSNHFSAAPNVGESDTITEPTAEYASYELLPLFPSYDGGELSRGVDVTPFSDDFIDEGVRRSATADGYPLAEEQYSIQTEMFSMVLSHLTDADKSTLFAFYRNYAGREIGVLNPADSLKYECLMASAPKCSIDKDKNRWKMEFSFRTLSTTTWS